MFSINSRIPLLSEISWIKEGAEEWLGRKHDMFYMRCIFIEAWALSGFELKDKTKSRIK